MPGLLASITGWVRAHPRLAMALALLGLLLIILKFIDYQQTQIRRLQLERSNAIAALDSTRNITAAMEDVLYDHEEAWQRQAVQEKAAKDSLDKALKLERKFSGQLQVHLGQLSAAFPAEVHREPGEVALVDLGQKVQGTDSTLGFTLAGTVAVPPEGPAQVSVGVTLDPISYGIRVGCGQAIEGVRPAQVTVTGPRAAGITLGQQSIDPDVCNAKRYHVVTGGSSCPLKALRCPAVSPLLDVTTWRFAAAATVELTSWLRPGILYTTGN